MRGRAGRLGLVLAMWALPASGATSAQSAGGSESSPLRVGLALSGGAARGLAHIGVLKVLAEAGIPIDVVSGTSMGSIIAGLHAAGHTADDLERIATMETWSRLLTDPVSRRELPVDRKSAQDRYLLWLPVSRWRITLPRGVIAGQRISQALARLTWRVGAIRDFDSLPVPFAAVATDLESGAAVVLDHGFLSEAMRASMALPSVFSPVEIDGRVLIDGGVIRNLPAEDARALGADVLICSDVTEPLESRDSLVTFIDVLVQSVSFRIWDSEARERALCDVLLRPDVRGFSSLGFGRVPELIARGAAAGRAALAQIEAVVPLTARHRAARAGIIAPDSVWIASVAFDRGRRVPQAFLAHTLDLKAPVWVTAATLDAAIDRLYATGLFESVRYQLTALPGDAPEARALTILVRERSADHLGVGLRYDSRYKASVLVSGAFGGIAGFGSSGQLDVRLGQQIRIGLGLSRSLGTGATVTAGGAADYVRGPFDLYDAGGGHRVAQVRVDLGSLGASIGKTFGTVVRLSARAKAEHAEWDDIVSAVDLPPIRRTLYSATGALELDTYDRGVWPRRGVGLKALSEWGGPLTGDGSAFSHHFGEVRGFLPLSRALSVWGAATLGASGGALPPHYQFFLGGANSYYLFPDRVVSFVGLGTQERFGRHLQKFEAGVQWEVLHNVFTRVRWNAGNVYQRWTWDPAGYLDGMSLDLGAKTFAGYLNLSVAARSTRAWPRVELDIGYPF